MNPKAIRTREAVVRVVFAALLVAGLCLLVVGLKHGGWIFAVAGFLIEARYLGARWLRGERSWIERGMRTLIAQIGGWRYQRAERAYLEKQALKAKDIRLAWLEDQVKELGGLGVKQRLEELERAEAWRSQQEWCELREVWQLLILDPKTPEELRHACREWLAKYPEALDFLARRLTRMGLLQEKDVPIEGNSERRTQHKWRVQ